MPDPHARTAARDDGRVDDGLTNVFRRRPPALPGPDARPELDARRDLDEPHDVDALPNLDARRNLVAHSNPDTRANLDAHPDLDAGRDPDAHLDSDARCPGCPLRSGGPPGPARAALRPVLPRPALLALADPRGTGTLVLPDAFRSSGPEAPTLEQALAETMLPFAAQRDAATAVASGRAARDPSFDELAAPDITVMQQASLPAPAARRGATSGGADSLTRWRGWWRSHAADPRVHLLLHLVLGALIVGGLCLLNRREPQTTAANTCTGE